MTFYITKVSRLDGKSKNILAVNRASLAITFCPAEARSDVEASDDLVVIYPYNDRKSPPMKKNLHSNF